MTDALLGVIIAIQGVTLSLTLYNIRRTDNLADKVAKLVQKAGGVE